MRKLTALAATVFVGLSITACSNDSDSQPQETVTVTATPTETPTPTPTQSIDDLFVQLVKDNTDAFDNDPDEDIIGAAKSVCDLWAAGGTIQDMFDVTMSLGIDPFDGGFLVGAGTETYCPEYSYMLEDSSTIS